MPKFSNLHLFLLIFFVSASSLNLQEILLIKSVDEIEQPISVGRAIKPISEDAIRNMFLNESLKLRLTSARSLSGNMFKLTPGDRKQTKSINELSKVALNVARNLAYSYGYENGKKHEYVQLYSAPKEYCPYAPKLDCDYSYPYRKPDGSCNNKENPWWGISSSPFKRILMPNYHDGLDEPRIKSITGRSLTNPRRIAMEVHFPKDVESKISNMFTHFSQYVDHDLTQTAPTSDEDGKPIKCFCSHNSDKDCVNIPIPRGDSINKDQRCMVLARSSSSYKKFDCRLGHREQLNLLTHWLDMSQTYGNNLEKTVELRLYYGGFLNSSVVKGIKRDYLPFTLSECDFVPEGQPCFKTGDDRIHQNILLLSIQTIFMREHNRIAGILAKLNPHWDDEKLFQEARRINTATYTHIIYNEWLPILVGKKAANLYGLIPLNQGYFTKYDPKLYPNVANEFSAGAFRFGHTLVRSFLSKADQNYRPFQNSSLKNMIFNPIEAFKKGGLDSYIRGCMIESSQKFDSNINDILTNHLFETKKDEETKRFSLPSINIQRGRDHGLPAYIHYRTLCGLNYPKDFDDLYNIPYNVRESMRKVYDHVADIDFFTGGISELPIEGGVVGPTFACIIAKQFRDLKYGDRFYYENVHKSTRFTVRQLDEIRKSTFARVLCDNSEISFIQKNPFLMKNMQTNPLMSCNNIESMNYRAWKAIV